MKNIQSLSYTCAFLFLIVFSSCNNADKSLKIEDTPSIQNNEGNLGSINLAIKDLLDKSIISDTIQMYSNEPFLFYKTGNLFDLKFRNSLVLTSPSDTTFDLKIYKLVDSAWRLTDSLIALKANKSKFYIESKDYNFDQQADIYIQFAFSDAYPMSQGHVILVDPVTKKLTLSTEASSLSNISIDPSTKILRSEALYVPEKPTNIDQIWVKRYNWVKGRMLIIDSSLEVIQQR